MLLLKIFYIVLFGALIFFGPLQEYLYIKKSEWDRKKAQRESKTDEHPAPADPEKTGGVVSIVLILLASVFFLWKLLTTPFTPV